MTTYQKDYFGWCSNQAAAIQNKQFESLDIDNLIEEIRSLGNAEKQRLISNLVIVFMHLLKWNYQSLRRSNSWKNSIAEHKRRVLKILNKNPSMKACLNECVEDAYQEARYEASQQTGLEIDTFPQGCPFALSTILNPDWLPE